MTRSVEHYCHRCGDVLREDYAVAEPFVACGRCGALNGRSSRSDEWDNLGIVRKALVVAGRLWFGLAGFFLVIPFSYVLGWYVTGELGTASSQAMLDGHPQQLLWPALAVGEAVAFARLFLAIKRSRDRMEDPVYRDRLRGFGLLGDSGPE